MKNIKYMFKNWVKWDKKSILFFIIRIPALVLQPIITAFIPKVMIDCITKGATIERLVVLVALLSLVVALITWLSPFMNELLKGTSKKVRMHYAVIAFKKTLKDDYKNIESIEGRKKNNQASKFYRSDYSPTSTFIEDLNQFFVCVVGVVASIVLINKINSIIVLFILIVAMLNFYLTNKLYTDEMKISTERVNETIKLDYFSRVSKNIQSAKDIKLYDFSSFFNFYVENIIHNLRLITKRYIPQSFKVNTIKAFLNFVIEFVSYLYLSLLVVNKKLEISDFIFYFGIISGFSNWVFNLMSSISKLNYCCKICNQYREYVEDHNDCENRQNVISDDVDLIEFKNVSFKYPSSENATLKNISFKVNKGERIAIIGENGAGKTTLVKLLCGLYKCTDGEIFINGENILNYTKNAYFDMFSVVFQDCFLMPMTLAENIASDTEYDNGKLYSALEKTGIKEKVDTLKHKENTLLIKDIYTDAIDFSGGEKQKILFSKALYKDAPIFILDEPTSALDPISESELYNTYNNVTKNKISFFISHRLSSTIFCDKIFFMENGEITEIGTHKELMAKKGSYFKMFNTQSYYYKEMENTYYEKA